MLMSWGPIFLINLGIRITLLLFLDFTTTVGAIVVLVATISSYQFVLHGGVASWNHFSPVKNSIYMYSI